MDEFSILDFRYDSHRLNVAGICPPGGFVFRNQALVVMAILVAPTLATSCSKSAAPTSPAVAAPTVVKSYIGVVAVPGNHTLAGALTLSATVPAARASSLRAWNLVLSPLYAAIGTPVQAAPIDATGTLGLVGGNNVQMTGTYDATSGGFSVAGGGFQLTGTASDSGMTGTGSHPSTSLPLGVVGTTASTVATETWGGTAKSNPGQNCGANFTSKSQFEFVLQQSGSAWTLTGQAVSDTDGTQVTFKGSAQTDGSGGGTATFTVNAPASYSFGSGTLSAGTWSGIYKGGDPSLCEVGTWSATRIR
jgi:hypothetical protein